MADDRGEAWRQAVGNDAYADLSGLEVIRAEPGYAEARLPITPRILNGHGFAHGGALFTLADYASALASNMLGGPVVGANASISYLRPVLEGEATAKARVVKKGRRLMVTLVEVFNSRGELAALFQGGGMTASGSPDRNGTRP